jgi:hypothetical protein
VPDSPVVDTEDQTIPTEQSPDEHLSLELPTDRNEKKDAEWLEKEDTKPQVEAPTEQNIPEPVAAPTPPTNSFSLDGLDLGVATPAVDLHAISMQKIQESEHRSAGMLNLDDL